MVDVLHIPPADGYEHPQYPLGNCSGRGWAINAKSEFGVNLYAQLLAAASEDFPIRVTGSGECFDGTGY